MWLLISKDAQKGFTLIELIIVIALMGIVMSVSISSFLSFNKSQTLQTAQLGVVNILQQAKSEAESQVNPCSSLMSPTSLDGYEVDIGYGWSATRHADITSYLLGVVCGGAAQVPSVKSLPSNITFTSSQIFIFKVLHGGVSCLNNPSARNPVACATITVKDQSGKTQTINVDVLGNIQYSH